MSSISLNRSLDLILLSLRLDPHCYTNAGPALDYLESLKLIPPVPSHQRQTHAKPREYYFSQLLINMGAWVVSNIRVRNKMAGLGTSAVPPTRPSAPKQQGRMFLLLGSSASSSTAAEKEVPRDGVGHYQKEHIVAEVRRFLTITFDEQDQKLEPLQYWNVKRKDFPLLSLVAVHVFVVLPHSCEAERTFSAAGNICNEQRSSLTNEMINHLVLIHRNDRLFRAEAAARAKAAAAEETAASAVANSNAAGHSVPGPPAPVVLE